MPKLLLWLLAGVLLVDLVACQPAQQRTPLEVYGLVVSGDKLCRSEDGNSLFLEGEVRNTSDWDVAFVHLRVRFYDSLGNLVRTGSGNPDPAKIQAGASSSFRIEIPYDPTITEYRVEILPE